MGFLLALFAATFGTAKDIVSKKLSFNVDGSTSAFASFAFAMPGYLLLLLIGVLNGHEYFSVTSMFWVYVICRSLTDTVAESTKMYALSHGELSAVVSIISLHPVFTLFTSPLLTGDPVTFKMALGVIITVLGSITIIYDGKSWPPKNAILYALICSLFFSLNNCFDRLSVTNGSPIFSGMIMNLLAGIFLIPSLLKLGKSKLLVSNWRPFLLRGCLESCFMAIKLTALQTITSPELGAIMRLTILFSVFSGNLMFKEHGLFRKVIGAVITVIGVSFIIGIKFF